MLFATNINSPSITERQSAERYYFLLNATKQERREEAEFKRQAMRADHQFERERDSRSRVLEDERKIAHLKKNE